MAKWDRNTPWRQGRLLTADAVAALGLTVDGAPQGTAVVVISHDCDLAQPPGTEPKVEVIVGRFVEGQPNGSFTHCKNLRRLHITCSAGVVPRVVELEATRRVAIDKDSTDGSTPTLTDHAPCPVHRMTAKERNTLQLWLAARYRRSAFPDEFDRRLKDVTDVAERLAKAFKDSGKYVTAVFFDVDEGQENTRQGPDDVYGLVITLLYATHEDVEAAEIAANTAAKRVDEIFRSRCTAKRDNTDVWQWIELQGVEVISDQALTYADSLQLTQWRADHISLRSDPEQPMLTA